MRISWFNFIGIIIIASIILFTGWITGLLGEKMESEQITQVSRESPFQSILLGDAFFDKSEQCVCVKIDDKRARVWTKGKTKNKNDCIHFHPTDRVLYIEVIRLTWQFRTTPGIVEKQKIYSQ